MEQIDVTMVKFHKGDIVIVNENINDYPHKERFHMKIGKMLLIDSVEIGYLASKDSQYYGIVYGCNDGLFYRDEWLTLYQQNDDFSEF